ncbi:hypothetical protein CAC42_464 [Sphaceloma murrayae]|uniref:Mitochondrial outer membrane transport complex Sam37/metaxin N-terminal domain-containing protein n=1 Tax=Sphaceloma murrayae TaxID=2082308 RepID=A0A2K1R3J3_9PEZI|nr:hypothetical protein CAC42_464 [Sphaceloma murrayae]
MRLYVLGPAFGCPSIDAQCNAAVALVKHAAQSQAQDWELVCALGNLESVPFLEDGGQQYYGFQSIAQHLAYDKGSAEHYATEAFLESNGQTLLDVSLYVSYENYAARTRPSYSHILPWYLNYLIPPERRAAARKRTEHLGITGIDMDDVHESVIDQPETMSVAERRFDEETKSRARLLLGKRHTVKSMLRSSAHAGAFKLKNLADNFYEPLIDLLGEKQYLFSDKEMSRSDFLAYGYLSLLLYPKVPQAWAAEMMRRDYQTLARYVERIHSQLKLHVSDDVAHDVLRDVSINSSSLPWTTLARPSMSQQISSCTQALLRQTPLAPRTPPVTVDESGPIKSRTLQDWVPQVASMTLAALILSGYVLYRNGIWPHGQPIHLFGRKRLSDYGAAGTALAILGGISPRSSPPERVNSHEEDGVVISEVQVDGPRATSAA